MLDRKRVLVTGGASGIGREITLDLYKAGYAVDYTFNRPLSEDAVHSLKDCCGYKCDFSDLQAVDQLAAQLGKNKYYGLIHNAGVSHDSLIVNTSTSSAKAVFDVNFWSLLPFLRNVTPYMLRSRSGRVVVVSSIASVRGAKGNSIYSASKGALNGLVRSLAVEFSSRNVTANAVLPGFIATGMTQQYLNEAGAHSNGSPVGHPKQVSALVAYLLGENAAFISGSLLPVDGGLSAGA